MAAVEVIDLRGLPLEHERRETAYPREPVGDRLVYLHMLNTRWYYDASDPRNADEAAESIGRLVDEAQNRAERDQAPGYVPFRVVVDNFGGTIIGRWAELEPVGVLERRRAARAAVMGEVV